MKVDNNINGIVNWFVNRGLKSVSNMTTTLIDVGGKGLLVPFVMIADNFVKNSEPSDRVVYSAVKNPVTAAFEALLFIPAFYAIWKGTDKLANKGLLDKDPNFSFNAKASRDKFLKSVQTMPGVDMLERQWNFIGDWSRLSSTEFRNGIEKIKNPVKRKAAEASYEEFRTVYKRLHHLKSRFAFVGVLAMIPAVCWLEDKYHPKVMKVIQKVMADSVNNREVQNGRS